VGYATLAYYIYQVWRERTPWRPALGRLALAGIWVIGLCAVQLLPSFQYTGLSTRADIPFDESATGFPLRDIVQLVLPGIVSLWQPLYVGIWPLVVALWAALTGRRRGRAFWIGLAVAALMLSFGQNLFGFDLAYLLAPGYALFRSQERHAFLFSFALSVLAAHGSDLLLSPLTRVERRSLGKLLRLVTGSLLVVFLLLLVVVVLSEAGLGDFTRRPFAERLGGLFLFLAATAGLLYGRWRRPRQRLAVGGLALALVVVDLFTVNRPVNYAPPREPFPYPPALAEALADELERLGRRLLCIAQARAREQKVEADMVVRQGPVRQTIEDFLQEVNASMLVLGVPRTGLGAQAFAPGELPQFAQEIRAATGVVVVVVE